MKKNLYFSIAAAVLFFIIGPASASTDPGGFLGLKWTQTIGDCLKQGLCSDQTITVDDKIASESIHYGKPKAFNGLSATFSSFAFHENKFYMGNAVFNSQTASYDNLRNSLIKTHGQPKSAGPKTTTWLLGNTKVTLYKGDSFYGVVYTHTLGFAKVAKIKNYPVLAQSSPAPVKKKK